MHTLADGRGRSLATLITPGQAADTRQLIPLLEHVRVARPGGPGRPRTRPESVTGDKAYSSRANRQALRGKRIRATIPEPNDQIANRKRRGSRGGRPAGEPLMRGLPRPVSLRQVPPRRAGAFHPADRVDDLPMIAPLPATDRLRRQQRLQHSPFLAAQITTRHTGPTTVIHDRHA